MSKYLKTQHISLDPDESVEVKEELKEVQEEFLEPGDMLRQLRVQKGWSVKELGSKLHISPSDITRMEDGEIQISDKVARELENLFQVDFSVFSP